MWDFLLCCQLLHLIQQDVHLELGAKILQTTVAEGLSVAKRNTNKLRLLSDNVVEMRNGKRKERLVINNLNGIISKENLNKENVHWSVDNEGHHDVHISDVLLQVWIRQVQLCAPVGDTKT